MCSDEIGSQLYDYVFVIFVIFVIFVTCSVSYAVYKSFVFDKLKADRDSDGRTPDDGTPLLYES